MLLWSCMEMLGVPIYQINKENNINNRSVHFYYFQYKIYKWKHRNERELDISISWKS